MNQMLDVFVNAPNGMECRAIDRVKQNKAAGEEEIKKADASRIANTKPSLSISAYAGIYSDDLYGAATVAEENGKLVLRFGPSPNFVADLDHWNYDTFQIKWRPSVAYNSAACTLHRQAEKQRIKIRSAEYRFRFYNSI